MTAQDHSVFPDPYDKQVKDLIDYHREHRQERLVLAVWYNRSNKSGSVYLLEVYERFPDPGQGILQTYEFPSTAKFPIKGRLKLVITSPSELKEASQRQDQTLSRIRKSKDKKKYVFGEIGERLYRDLVS